LVAIPAAKPSSLICAPQSLSGPSAGRRYAAAEIAGLWEDEPLDLRVQEEAGPRALAVEFNA
jgi:hypothetical protein